MDLQSHMQNDQKSAAMSLLFDNMPKYLSSKHRVHRLFFKKCDDQIGTYQNCIGDTRWKANIDKYINDSMRRKCYNEWVQVRRCAVKNMGDTFAMKINMTRQIEDYEDEEAIIENYKLYYENKKFLHRYEKIQGPPAEEEAAEGEEGEPAEEEGSSEENAEESSEEKTEEAAAGEEKTEESTEGEPASDESRDSPVNEDGSAGDAVEHTEIKAEEESDE